MKKIFAFLAAAVLFAGCGVGSYSVSSGKPDEAYLSVTSTVRKDYVTVKVDDASYDLLAAYRSDFKPERRIKQTARNTIALTPGTHVVTVTDRSGKELVSKKIFVSAQEHKIIDL